MNKVTCDQLFEQMTQWHEDRNLIDGSTNKQQLKKLMEEVAELFATVNPALTAYGVCRNIIGTVHDLNSEGRIRQAPKGKTIADDVGDINVVLAGMVKRDELTMRECLQTGYDDIKHRKGRMSKDGIFIKEGD